MVLISDWRKMWNYAASLLINIEFSKISNSTLIRNKCPIVDLNSSSPEFVIFTLLESRIHNLVLGLEKTYNSISHFQETFINRFIIAHIPAVCNALACSVDVWITILPVGSEAFHWARWILYIRVKLIEIQMSSSYLPLLSCLSFK